MRDKLVKLIKKNPYANTPYSLADHLIANGVTIAEDTNVLTNADRIRAMSDEELAKMLYGADSLGYCKNLSECQELLDTVDGIPEEKCVGCALKWLQQPVEDISEAVSNCGARMDGDGDG